MSKNPCIWVVWEVIVLEDAGEGVCESIGEESYSAPQRGGIGLHCGVCVLYNLVG